MSTEAELAARRKAIEECIAILDEMADKHLVMWRRRVKNPDQHYAAADALIEAGNRLGELLKVHHAD